MKVPISILINSPKKYQGADKYPMRSPDEKRIIVKIKPNKVLHFLYSSD